jgi:transposase
VWLAPSAGQGDVHFALEGCTGWQYVVEELVAAEVAPHLAGPADTPALRARSGTPRPTPVTCGCTCWPGPARVLDPPEHVLEARAVVRLYKVPGQPRGRGEPWSD